MIHRGHNCHPAEPVVVSIEVAEAPESGRRLPRVLRAVQPPRLAGQPERGNHREFLVSPQMVAAPPNLFRDEFV
jgi:hypothetical protein